MSKAADHLLASRAAHRDATNQRRLGNTARAIELLHVALEERYAARRADPKKADPEWLNDALTQPRPGETARRHHRVPGLTVKEVAAMKDAELEVFYRQQIGEIAQPRVRVTDPEVVTPKQWIVTKEGAVDTETGQLVDRGRHAFQLLTFDQRTCTACGQVEELRETKTVEETDAFKQLQKERG